MLWQSKKTGGDIQDVYKQEFHISFGFFACGKGRVGGEGFVTLLCRMGAFLLGQMTRNCLCKIGLVKVTD